MKMQIWQQAHDGLNDWTVEYQTVIDANADEFNKAKSMHSRESGNIGDLAEYRVDLLNDNDDIIDSYFADTVE